jgi:hypothetical protein
LLKRRAPHRRPDAKYCGHMTLAKNARRIADLDPSSTIGRISADLNLADFAEAWRIPGAPRLAMALTVNVHRYLVMELA